MKDTRARNEDETVAMESDVTPIDDSEEFEDSSVETSDPEPDDRAASSADASDRPPPAAELPPEAAAARLTEQLDILRSERDRLYDAWLRTTADFDNYRKRTERERDEFRQYAMESMLLQLLPVLDNFERAIESLPAGAQRGFAEGVQLIHKQLGELLAKHGVTSIPTAGETFDPHLHEAVETETRTNVEHHTILAERQKGYRLGKRVLRPARVKVAVRPDDEAGADDADSRGGIS